MCRQSMAWIADYTPPLYSASLTMKAQSFDMTVQQILEINKVIAQLDVSVRAHAFELLTRVLLSQETNESVSGRVETLCPALPLDGLGGYVSQHHALTPAKNTLMLAAWIHFHQSGSYITPQKLRALADVCNIQLPRRPDCTMRYASHRGLSLFERNETGWRLSAYGQAYVRQNYPLRNSRSKAKAVS
jgi:hypothetical protein